MTTKGFMPEGFSIVEYGTHHGIQYAVAHHPAHFRWPERNKGYVPYNGYILLPEGHPFREIPDGEYGFNDDRMSDIRVNGGITYNENNIWGFDTGHSHDYTPWMNIDGWPDLMTALNGGPPHRWTLNEVREETKSLAEQIAKHNQHHHYEI